MGCGKGWSVALGSPPGLARLPPPHPGPPPIGTRAPAQEILQAALGRSLHLCLVISVQWARVHALPTTASRDWWALSVKGQQDSGEHGQGGALLGTAPFTGRTGPRCARAQAPHFPPSLHRGTAPG